MSSTAPEPAPAPAPEPQPTRIVVTALPCTGCYGDAKQAVLAGKTPDEIPEPLPGVVMANGVLFCDVRHVVNFGPPPSPLLIAPAHAMPTGGLV